MLQILTNRQLATHTEYHIEFTNDEGGGFSFNATADGKVILENKDQRTNYEHAMKHPEEYPVQFNEFVARKIEYVQPAVGVCECGNALELVSQYMGAFQCSECGRWYNVFGQELLDPEFWEE